MMSSAQTDKYAFAAQEDRSAHRMRLSIPATLRPAGGKKIQTVVRNLSLSGFSATAISRVLPSTVCWLTLPGQEAIQAKVVWWEQGLIGCAFDDLLGPLQYEAILLRWQGEGVYRG